MRNIKKTSIAQMKDKKEETKFLSAAATLTQAEQEQVGCKGIIVKYVILHILPKLACHYKPTLQTNYKTL